MSLNKKILSFSLVFLLALTTVSAQEENESEFSIPITTTEKEGVTFTANWRPNGSANWHFLSEPPLDNENNHLIYKDKKTVKHFFGKDGEKEIKFKPYSKKRITQIIWKGENLVDTIPKGLTQLKDFYYLDLSNNQLSGEIPKYIKDLTDLEVLNFQKNNFEGEIPKEIGKLKNLKRLSLHNNELKGEIPKEIGELSNLQELYLHNNELTGFNNIFSKDKEKSLSNLEVLTLKNNNLQSLPEEIINFKSLYILNLKNNELTSLFKKFKTAEKDEEVKMNLDNLEYLGAANNLLGCEGYSLPSEIGNLQSLSKLHGYHLRDTWHPRKLSIDLRYNCLTEIPESIGNLQALDSLRLDNNKIKTFSRIDKKGNKQMSNEENHAIPPSFKNLANEDSNLKFRLLSLYNNELTGKIPAELGELKNLEILRLQNNNLSGNIPSKLLDLDKLITLNIENNELNLAPSQNESENESQKTFESAKAGSLQWLFAGRNKITNLPNNLELPSIRFLYLEENELKELPENFGDNVGNPIQELTLYKNKLSKLPKSFNNLSNNLYYLDLGTNNIEEFPKGITKLSGLKYLNLSRQSGQTENTGQPIQGQMSGNIPKEITELSALKTLLINNNALTSLPTEGWSKMGNLEYFYSQNNSINNFPEKIGSLSSLERLYINNNKISVSIPAKVVKNTSSLKRFYGQYNKFSGQLPSPESNGWDSLKRFFADENNISGGLNKKFLKGLSSVEYFSIANNDLNGEINQEIKNMTSLRWLDLANNEGGVTGNLPSEIKNLNSLETFDFNNNQLSKVPNELNEITSLENIYGFENKITDFANDIGKLNNLVRFDFHNSEKGTNKIPFPEGVEKLSNLKYFSLGENESGEGEVDWEKWSGNLPSNMLFLNNNDLNGNLSDEMLGEINKTVVFNVRDNNFKGGFPE